MNIVEKIANSHSNIEGTDRPIWWILDPKQMMSPNPHQLYQMFHGPFFSRETATDFFEATRYRYGKNALVYCGSANSSPQMKELWDFSKAQIVK